MKKEIRALCFEIFKFVGLVAFAVALVSMLIK